jgi:L-ascorbate metabolism protein UlaG (beta-lactamase superfamily)
MKIYKIGHCCLTIETSGKRIMTDPGSYSTNQDREKEIDVVLITHEHSDHFHIESLKKVLENNPQAKIITNMSVGKLLEAEGIAYEILEDGGSRMEGEVLIEGLGEQHIEIYKTWERVQNTGYFINPGKDVDILALPVAGPWAKISDAVDYALLIKPRVAFPVHDAGLKNPGMAHRVPSKVLPENGIEFVPMLEGDERLF